MAYEPPSGSIVDVIPVSYARICCVRRPRRAASFARQAHRLVVRRRRQRLHAAEHGGQRLVGDADDVVERFLGRLDAAERVDEELGRATRRLVLP